MNKNSKISYVKALKILTPSEIKVLDLVEKGLTNQEIAEQLGNSQRTIQSHRFNICKKLKISGVNGIQKWFWSAKNKDNQK